MGNFYQFYESEKVRLLSRYPDDVKRKVEQSITKQVKENMKKNKSNFLNVADLLDIKEITKYFDALLINGPRAIGKSYSVKHFLLKRFRDHQERFGWIRNTQEQALKNLKNDGMFWSDFGYEISISNRAVVSLKDEDKAVNEIKYSIFSGRRLLDPRWEQTRGATVLETVQLIRIWWVITIQHWLEHNLAIRFEAARAHSCKILSFFVRLFSFKYFYSILSL